MRTRRRGPLAGLLVLGLLVVAWGLTPPPAAVLAQEDTTTTAEPSAVVVVQQETTTTPAPTTTAPTTQAPPTTPVPTTPTTQPTTTPTTASATSTTTATTVATTAASTDGDDDSGVPAWVWLGLAALVVLVLIAWLISTLSRRRTATARWEARRAALLDDAQRAHEDTVDLLARWAPLGHDQLAQRWSVTMEGLQRLRSHLARLLADAPEGTPVRSMERVAAAVDDLRIALGQTDLGTSPGGLAAGPSAPPASASPAANALQHAIDEVQHPDDDRHR